MTRRARRWTFGLLAVVVAIPLAGFLALLTIVRSDAIRPRVQDAVQAATGRAFTLSGPIGLSASLVPTITLDGPALANLPGGSRPDMLRARRIEAEVALLPLLSRRVEVRSLRLIAPDLLLETVEGQPNWRLGPAARPEVVAPPPAVPAAPSQPLALDVASLTVEDGRITWRGATTETVEVPRLALRSAGADTRVEGRVAARGVAATVAADTGPLAPLLRGAGNPWPFRLAVSAEGANAEATGTLDLPITPAGWRARLAVTADSTARFAPLLPGVALPPARGLSGVVEADGTAGVKSAHLAANEVPLPPAFRGMVLAPVQVSASAPDAPATLAGTARIGDLSLALGGTGPTLAALRMPDAAWPVAVTLEGEGVAVSARTTVPPGLRAGQPAATEGMTTLRLADAAGFAARLGLSAPALHDAALDATWRLLPEGTDVPAFTLTAREAAGRGSVSIRRADPVPAVQARMEMERLDLDALRPAAPPAPPGATAAQPASPPVQPGARADGRVIPDIPLPITALRSLPVSADLGLTVGTLRVRGHDWRSVAVTAKAGGGRLDLERLSAESPGGALAGMATADATGERPTLALALRSAEAGVDLGPLLEALGASAPVRGRARVDVSVRGGGDGLRAYLGSLDGHAAVSMGAGTLDPALIGRVTAALRGIVPDGALGQAAALRCLEVRFGVAGGVATAETAVLRTGLGGTTATGSVNLRDETLALRLNPVVRVGSVSVTTPVTVGGRFAAPSVAVDRGGAAAAAAGLLGGLARRSGDEDTAALGALAEALAGGEAAVPGCEGVAAAPAPRAARPGVGDVLRGLLGR